MWGVTCVKCKTQVERQTIEKPVWLSGGLTVQSLQSFQQFFTLPHRNRLGMQKPHEGGKEMVLIKHDMQFASVA